MTGASVVAGKDYLRLAKSEGEAWSAFQKAMERAAASDGLGGESLIYIITEPAAVAKVPQTGHVSFVRFTADTETLKSRFAARTKGQVPPPLAAMLERQKAAFDAMPAGLSFDTTTDTTSVGIAAEIVKRCGGPVQSA